MAYASPERVLATRGTDALLALLSPDERERQERFRYAEDRAVYLTAHALTRSLLARALDAAPLDLSFVLTERGRPELAGPAAESGVRFNLSHTQGLVACAITLHDDVGVDVEELGRKIELASVAQRVFSSRERAGLDALAGDAQRRRFFDLWTLKESYVKATGKGLAGPLQSVSFAAEAPDPVPVHFDPEAQDRAEDWCFRRQEVAGTHLVAAALRAGVAAAISFEEWHAADLGEQG